MCGRTWVVLPHLKFRRTGCGIPSAARTLLGPEGLSTTRNILTKLELHSNVTLYVECISPRGWTLYVESHCHGPMGLRAI